MFARAGRDKPGRLEMPRRRGAASGALIVALGAVGALAPFAGPAIDLTIGPDAVFDMTAGRFWLSLLPGVAAVLGGALVLRSSNRATAAAGAQLALAAGAWFVVGPTVSMLWNGGVPQTGAPLGGTERQVLALLVYFYATGAAIAGLAGVALGRVSGRLEGDERRLTEARAQAREAERRAARERVEALEADQPPAGTAEERDGGGRFGREREREPERHETPRT